MRQRIRRVCSLRTPLQEMQVPLFMGKGLSARLERVSYQMVRTGYQRGRANEYRAMELLRKEGWLVLRTAGSHSPIDLFAAKDGNRLLVQVKSGEGRLGREGLEELVRWAKGFRGSAEIWHFKGRAGLEKKTVYRAKPPRPNT